LKLLIVDDSKVILKMAQKIIENHKLCDDVSTASSGEECLEIIEKEDFDVVLLDIIMLKLNGLQVLARMKENGALKRMKVIMFTSLSDRNALKESFELGASDYINKPIEPIEFSSRIRSVMRQKYLEDSIRDQFEESVTKNRELRELYEELRRTQVQMIEREKLIGIGQLAAGIAHEINNPLGFVMSNLTTLVSYNNSMEKLRKETIEWLNQEKIKLPEHIDKIREEEYIDDIIEDIPSMFEDMNDGLSRIKEVVKGVRFFSRVDSSNTIERVEISDVLNSILILTEKDREGIVTVVINDASEFVECITGDINKSVLNIVLNSIHALRATYRTNKELRIKASSNDGKLMCEIIDTGVGIPREHIDDVYNPFFTTKEVGAGSGLGLTVVYETIVNKHKGQIDIVSEEGKGTIVRFSIPLKFMGERA